MTVPIPTDIEVAIGKVRAAQLQHDQAVETLQRSIEVRNAATEQVNTTGTMLSDTKEYLLDLIVAKPAIRVVAEDPWDIEVVDGDSAND